MEEITVNPLNGLVSQFIRPKWMCKHPRAELIDRKRMVYVCEVCNPSKGGIKVIPYTKPGSSSKGQNSPKGQKSPKGQNSPKGQKPEYS